MDIFNMTAFQIAQKIKNKHLSTTELTQHFFKTVKNKSNSYICFTEDYAYEKAKKLQQKIDKKENISPLAGVIVSIKDNICTKNITTTAASKMLKNYVPTYNATVFEKLENAGAILVGKLNLDEFAMGDTGSTSFWGRCLNPWDNEKSTGGSSSGSASSIAYDEAIFTLGSDTGGSIRQPAGFCSVTGFKPSYGVVSRYGLISFAPQFDQIGPVTKDAIDCAKTLEIISGYDINDNTTLKNTNFHFVYDNFNMKNIKIAVCKNFIQYSDKNIQKQILNAISILKNMGAIIEEIDLDIIKYCMPTYQILSSAMAVSNMARYDGIKYGYKPKNITDFEEICVKSRTEAFGVEVKKRIIYGNFVLKNKDEQNSLYNIALNAKNYITKQFKDVLSKYDLILTPTTPVCPPSIKDSLETDTFLVAANLCGLPAISIPCGFTDENLPVGMQLIGGYLKDDVVLNVAIAFQQFTDFHLKKPNIN